MELYHFAVLFWQVLLGLYASVEQIGDFYNPNPAHNFHRVIRLTCSDIWSNPVYIRKSTLIKALYCSGNAVWISISDPVEFFSKTSPILIQFWIAEFGWIAIRKPDHVQHWFESLKKMKAVRSRLIPRKHRPTEILVLSTIFASFTLVWTLVHKVVCIAVSLWIQ